MAIFLFANAIVEGKPIKLFNHGKMRRDFTYIDDVTRVISQLIERAPQAMRRRGRAGEDLQCRQSPPRGADSCRRTYGKELGRTAEKEMLPMQPEMFRKLLRMSAI